MTETVPERTPEPRLDDGAGPRVRLVGVREFAKTREALSDPLLGSREERDVVVAAGSDVIFYGAGGDGKTTLQVDLAAHMGAGVDWHGIPVARPVRQAIVENEGARAEFRLKIEQKLDSWEGPSFEDHVRVLDEPWGEFTLEDTGLVGELAAVLAEEEYDLVWLGPGAEIGMTGGGTPDDIRAFGKRTLALRQLVPRPLALVIPHHENKAGDVSGAWDRWPGTLIRVERENRTTKLTFRKTRHSSSRIGTTMVLAWADNESYTLIDTGTPGPRKAPADAIAIWIRAEGGRATPKAIRDHFDISDSTLRDRRAALAEQGIDYRADGKKVEYLDRHVYPAIAGSETESHPEAAPRGESRGDDIAGSNGSTMRDPDPAPRDPAIQTTAGSGKRSEQGKSLTPHPASLTETDPPPAGSGSDLTESDLEELLNRHADLTRSPE